MIEIKNLSFEYSAVKVLDNVSFNIPEGTITVIIGPNGAGKTTLLECMAGIKKNYNGKILINNLNLATDTRQCHRLIGFLSGFRGVYDDLTIRQGLTFFALAHKIPKKNIPQRISEITDKLNLKDKLDEKVHTLSRGTKQRLALAQTIIHNPKILLLNKPSQGLDSEAEHLLIEYLLELNRKEKLTIIAATHLLSEFERSANQYFFIKDGKLSEGVGNQHEKRITFKMLVFDHHKIAELQHYAGVSNIYTENNVVTLSFAGDEKNQAELLKFLVEKQFEISDFFVKKI